MKRVFSYCLVAAFLFLLLSPSVLKADVQFGLRVGGNSAKLTGDDLKDIEATVKSKVGFVGGVFLAFNLGKMITIEPEILYTMKGGTVEDTAGEYSEKVSGDYLEIPLLIKVKLPLGSIRPVIFAGPAVGFKLREKYELNGEELPLEEKILKNNDYGAIFGAGLDIGRHFMIDVRYSLGLQKIITAVDEGTSPDIKNGVWSATIGIAF
ncbi:MAG TPA: porin family protein [Candidatus Saccharicenans sp.]|nr:porin family protein [Candidatus Saccharicenans sp.]